MKHLRTEAPVENVLRLIRQKLHMDEGQLHNRAKYVNGLLTVSKSQSLLLENGGSLTISKVKQHLTFTDEHISARGLRNKILIEVTRARKIFQNYCFQDSVKRNVFAERVQLVVEFMITRLQKRIIDRKILLNDRFYRRHRYLLTKSGNLPRIVRKTRIVWLYVTFEIKLVYKFVCSPSGTTMIQEQTLLDLGGNQTSNPGLWCSMSPAQFPSR